MKKSLLLILLLLAAFAPWAAQAQTKTHIATTSTSTTMTWNEFASNVNNGTTYQGMTVYLDEDITATTMAGTNENNCFKGTFDGQVHTLTFNYTATAWYTAPFCYLNGATIKDLKVSGTITTDVARCAGFAGHCYGDNNFINCMSNITINSTLTDAGFYGGFVSVVRTGITTFEGCTFTGKLLGSTHRCGGFVGSTVTAVVFNNCIFNPTEITIGLENCASFSTTYDNNAVININNCYYTSAFNDGTNYVNQGKQRYTITAVSPVTVAMNGTATNYDASHITAYSDNPGLLYNGTIIAGEGEQVSLNLNGGGNSYLIDHGILTGDSNPRTLTMEAYNTVIGLNKTHIANSSTSTAMTWDEFAQYVNNGMTYYGTTLYLDEDITATTMAGTNETNCFQGTFDGQGHTLTFNYTATAWYTAPFSYLNGATIRNLKVDGTITANAARSAGLAGACYGNTTITNCLSDITINSSISGDGTYGGFVSMVREGTTTFEGCTFTGRLLGSGTYRSGGLTGCTISTVVFNNCVFDPTEITIGLDNSASFSREFPDSNAVINVNNCYYTYAFNDGTNYVNQGKQRYTVTGQNPVSVAMNGTATNYNVSHITTYSDNPGLLYNGTIIAGEGEQVSLNLDGGSYGYHADHGTLTGSANPYTLTMEASNTTITAPIYSDDFENGMDGWIFVNDESLTNNAWCWGTAAHNGEGTHGIYISNDGGNNFQYNYSPTYDRLYAYKTFEFEEGDYKIDFDVISGFTWYPSAYSDKLSLWLVPASNDPSQGVEAGGTRLNNTSSVISDWQTMSYEFSILTAGSYRLVFMWECAVGQWYIKNYGEDYFYENVYNKPHTPAAIDNVNITQIIGRKPTRLQCTTQGNTATLNWVDYNDTAGWQICLNGDESNLITTFSKPYTITGLTYDTTYTAKVRTIINNDATDWSDEISFTPTHLNPPTNLQCPIATHENTSLRWTENYSDIDHWEICLNGDESNLINATTNPFAMAGLTTDATYTAKVRSVTTYGESTWSEEISFVPAINTVTVLGTGTETIIGLPFANHATDVQTQQIYTADELGAAGDILSIAFYKTGTTPCSRNLTIYMTPTSQDQCTSFLDWVDTSDGQLVFSGTVNFANNGWTTITLSTPFTYNGLQNLALTVFDQTTTAGETANFLCYLTLKKQAMVLESGANATCTNKKNQIRIVKNGIHTDITGYGTGTGNWSLVASPLAGEVNPVYYSNMIWNSFDLYRFNPSASMEWENWKQEGDHYHFNLESGRGYLYANSENVTLVFSGVPYSGNGQVTLSKDDNAPLGQWNLIGNPLSTNATLGTKPFYIMNEYGTEIIAADNDHRVIAPMQGIFVEANEEGEIVTFTAQARGGESANESIVLNLSQGGPSTGSGTSVIDRAIVRFGEGEALHKLQIREGNTKVYIPQDNEEYAIVSVGRDGVHTVSTKVPINFKASENGTYTLAANLEGVEMEYLHLIDNMTGADVDLLALDGGDAINRVSTYTFTARTTDYESRFKLVFVCRDANDDNEAFAFIDAGGNIVIDGEGTVQVIDVMGQVIASTDGACTVSTNGMTPGVYVLRLINGDNVKTQKIIVR